MDGLIGLCEWPNTGLRCGTEAGVCWGHDAAQVGGNIFLVTYHHLQVVINYVILFPFCGEKQLTALYT